MCSGTNFIKTLELNELVNHIAQLGCCPALDWPLAPLSSLCHPFPCPSLFRFALSLRLYLFLLQCGLKNNFRKQKCNERRNELQSRTKRKGRRPPRGRGKGSKLNEILVPGRASSWPLKKRSIKISVQRRKGLNDRKLYPKTQKPKLPPVPAHRDPKRGILSPSCT